MEQFATVRFEHVIYRQTFLPRDTIHSASAVLAVVMSVRPSVRLSLRHILYCNDIETAKDIKLSRHGSAIIAVFLANSTYSIPGGTRQPGDKYTGVRKIAFLANISLYLG